MAGRANLPAQWRKSWFSLNGFAVLAAAVLIILIVSGVLPGIPR